MKSKTRHVLIYSLFYLLTMTTCYAQNNRPDNNSVQTETIALKYRLAEELVPLLKPFLHPKGIMNGQGRHILIKTSVSNLAEIKQFIRDIDVPLRNLLITLTVDGDLVSKENANIKHYSTAKRNTTPSTHQVQTLEGQWATLNTGELNPVGQEKHRSGGSIGYRQVSGGFQARARVHGDRVTVEMRPKLHSNSRQGGGRIDVQRADTRVSGQLGEWIMIGGVESKQRQKKGVRTYSTERDADKQKKIYVKVDVQK